MQVIAELLKAFLDQASGAPNPYPQNNDARMAVPPMEGEAAGKIMKPDQMQTQMQPPPPGTISNDKGELVDFNFDSNPFRKLIDKLPAGEQGTITGFLKGMFGSKPMKDQPLMDRSGTTPRIGGGIPGRVPGTGTDAVLDKTPMPKQRPMSMTTPPPSPPPVDYSQPTALDPQSIEELRTSLLTQSGQMDPNNPNGLSGRMNSPYYPNDKYNQMSEAQRQHDELRGFDGSRSARLKKGKSQ